MRRKCRVLTSFFDKGWGLMFSSKVREPLVFVFACSAKHGIHSFFCPDFDAVFLDEEFKVVDKFEVRSSQPWLEPKSEARYLIEAEPGFASNVKEGQRLGVDLDDAWLEAP
ncbi:DUF192 domain-containing protein [Candidatus Micrarchaeota archaeon]|nr:DUF192 domain-containing protein [Candidatus Micrarchaeota archaeon]